MIISIEDNRMTFSPSTSAVELFEGFSKAFISYCYTECHITDTKECLKNYDEIYEKFIKHQVTLKPTTDTKKLAKKITEVKKTTGAKKSTDVKKTTEVKKSTKKAEISPDVSPEVSDEEDRPKVQRRVLPAWLRV